MGGSTRLWRRRRRCGLAGRGERPWAPSTGHNAACQTGSPVPPSMTCRSLPSSRRRNLSRHARRRAVGLRIAAALRRPGELSLKHRPRSNRPCRSLIFFFSSDAVRHGPSSDKVRRIPCSSIRPEEPLLSECSFRDRTSAGAAPPQMEDNDARFEVGVHTGSRALAGTRTTGRSEAVEAPRAHPRIAISSWKSSEPDTAWCTRARPRLLFFVFDRTPNMLCSAHLPTDLSLHAGREYPLYSDIFTYAPSRCHRGRHRAAHCIGVHLFVLAAGSAATDTGAV